jgi:hypothetical protein
MIIIQTNKYFKLIFIVMELFIGRYEIQNGKNSNYHTISLYRVGVRASLKN